MFSMFQILHAVRSRPSCLILLRSSYSDLDADSTRRDHYIAVTRAQPAPPAVRL